MHTADYQAQLSQISARIIGSTVRSKRSRTLLFFVANDLIGSWADTGGMRHRLASPFRWIAAKVLTPGRNGSDSKISSELGTLLTVWAKKVNAEHAQDAACHARTRGETIHSFLSNTDFGEIREMA